MAHPAGAWRAGTGRLGQDGAVPGPVAEDRSAAVRSGARTVRSWPLLVLAAPAAAEVWSGWVGIAQKTGFGLVSPLPGIWPSLHLDTTITLPVGVEAYAAYALRAWLARDSWITSRTRRFAKWSAICSFALGMAGQIAYHLLAQAGTARAPWPITTVVSCLPVLVLAMGTALAHMLRADAGTATDTPADGGAGPATPPRPACPAGDQAGPVQDQSAGQGTAPLPGPQPGTRTVPVPERAAGALERGPSAGDGQPSRSERGERDRTWRPVSQPAAHPAATASTHNADEVAGPDNVNGRAVAAYRRSMQAGNPLSERKLAQMFGQTSRRWARARIAEARREPPTPETETGRNCGRSGSDVQSLGWAGLASPG